MLFGENIDAKFLSKHRNQHLDSGLAHVLQHAVYAQSGGKWKQGGRLEASYPYHERVQAGADQARLLNVYKCIESAQL